MKRTTWIAATSASAVALGIAAVAYGHGGPRAGESACPAGQEEHCGTAQESGRGGHGMGGHGMGGGVSQSRIDALRAALKLTSAQQAVFDKYAALVATQTEARQRMYQGMHSGTADHHAMHDTMRAFNRQAATELAAARQELDGVLSAEQRAIVDRTLGDSHMAMRGGRVRHH